MKTMTEAWQDLAAIEKDRRKKDRDGWEVLTAAHEAARAGMDAQCGPDGRCDQQPLTGDSAAKGIAGDRGRARSRHLSPSRGRSSLKPTADRTWTSATRRRRPCTSRRTSPPAA